MGRHEEREIRSPQTKGNPPDTADSLDKTRLTMEKPGKANQRCGGSAKNMAGFRTNPANAPMHANVTGCEGEEKGDRLLP